MVLQTAQRIIANVELTAACENAPTKQPAINTIRNITRRLRWRAFWVQLTRAAATSMMAAVAIAVVISVILSDRPRATCAPEENAKGKMPAKAAGLPF